MSRINPWRLRVLAIHPSLRVAIESGQNAVRSLRVAAERGQDAAWSPRVATQSGQDSGELTGRDPERTRGLRAYERRPRADKTCRGAYEARFVALKGTSASCEWPFRAHEASPRARGATGVADGRSAEASDPLFRADETRFEASDPRTVADKTRLGVHKRRSVAHEPRFWASGTCFVALKGAVAPCPSPFRAHKTGPRASETTGVADGPRGEASDARSRTGETRARPSRPRGRAGRMRPGASAARY